MSGVKCNCCGTEIKSGNICKNCDFERVNVLGGSDDINEKNAEEYRQELLKSITDISVVKMVYGVKDDKFVETGKASLKIADGVACYGKVAWAGAEICKNQPGDNIEGLSLSVSYKFKGAEKSVTVSDFKRPAADNNFWDIGVKIDNKLNLSVFLGNSTNSTESSKAKLKLY